MTGSGYDVTRLTVAGPVTVHHEGPVALEGPWMILHTPGDLPPAAFLAAHAVVGAFWCSGGEECEGGSRGR